MIETPSLNGQPQTRITLKETSEVACDECSCVTFTEAVMMRKASRILTGAPKDSYVPIPVFTCTACGHVNDEFVPAELKAVQPPKFIMEGR